MTDSFLQFQTQVMQEIRKLFHSELKSYFSIQPLFISTNTLRNNPVAYSAPLWLESYWRDLKASNLQHLVRLAIVKFLSL